MSNVPMDDGKARILEGGGKGTGCSTLRFKSARSRCDPGREGTNCLRRCKHRFSFSPTSEFSEGAVPVRAGSVFPREVPQKRLVRMASPNQWNRYPR